MAEGKVEWSKAALEAAKLNLSYTRIVVPIYSVVGQRVLISVDMLPDAKLTGHVESLASVSSVSFSPVASDNATGNFTKVVQRLPVKIVFDRDQSAMSLLKVGMSVTPTVLLAKDLAH